MGHLSAWHTQIWRTWSCPWPCDRRRRSSRRRSGPRDQAFPRTAAAGTCDRSALYWPPGGATAVCRGGRGTWRATAACRGLGCPTGGRAARTETETGVPGRPAGPAPGPTVGWGMSGEFNRGQGNGMGKQSIQHLITTLETIERKPKLGLVNQAQVSYKL